MPEDQNFGAISFFREIPVANTSLVIPSRPAKSLEGLVKIKDVADKLPSSTSDSTKKDSLPNLGRWQNGDPLNPNAVQVGLEAFLKQQKPDFKIPAKATPSQLFGLICPILAELRTYNASRPYCRFKRDYGPPHPGSMAYGGLTAQIKVSQILAYDERLALLSHDPSLALQDVQVGWKIASGYRQEPLIISQVVGNGVVLIQLPTVNQGLAEHIWNDSQLATDYYSSHRTKWLKDELTMNFLFSDEEDHDWKNFSLKATYLFIPNGWFERFKANYVKKTLLYTDVIDRSTRCVHPDRVPDSSNENGDWRLHWLNSITTMVDLHIVESFAYTQVQVDEARIACRLERYRLAHGAYPAALEALVPDYGDLPHDIMNGEPYHYKLNPDGTYILYSVGWNQNDDHGNAGPHRNKDSPDWIWTNYPDKSKS